jgi:hypothetical protein
VRHSWSYDLLGRNGDVEAGNQNFQSYSNRREIDRPASQPIKPDGNRFRTNFLDVDLLNPNRNIFVSFTTQDQPEALEILGRIEAADLKCWISCRDVERLGHSTISVTLDLYSHVTETMQSDAASKLDAAFQLAITRTRK